jgi:hypothetical protein
MDISFKLGSKQNSNLKMQLNQYNKILNNQKNMILALHQQNALRQQQQVVAHAPVVAPAPVVAHVVAPAPVVAHVVAPASMNNQPHAVKKLPKKGFNVLF